jgi:hypothetical protein
LIPLPTKILLAILIIIANVNPAQSVAATPLRSAVSVKVISCIIQLQHVSGILKMIA